MDNNRFKFRAWDKVHNIMLHDVTVYQNADHLGIPYEGEEHYTEEQIESSNGQLSCGDNDWLFILNGFVLMQWTGLMDKLGTPIYEGDIVSGWRAGSNSDLGYTGIVEWNTQQCGFVIRQHKHIIEIISLAMAFDTETPHLTTFHVVANLYENPEFINQNKQ
mgnify:CR=1 FL=1